VKQKVHGHWGQCISDLSPKVKHTKKVFPVPKPSEQPNSRRHRIKSQQDTVILHKLQKPAVYSNLPPRALCSVPCHATAPDRHSCWPQRWTLATSGSHRICRTEMFPLSLSILCKQIHNAGASLEPKNYNLPPSSYRWQQTTRSCSCYLSKSCLRRLVSSSHPISPRTLRIIEQPRLEGTLEVHLVQPFMGKGA